MASEASCSHHLPMTMEAITGENKFEKYDVFLSHRGPDTKTGFVGFLYNDLEKHGLQPYLDCKSIRIGEECWKSIEDGIKNTPIAVVVFSERYAESEWCLKELHVMLKANLCKKILPIFYNVTPWDLRNPERGQYKDGFEKLKKKFNSNLIEQWKGDLEVASKLMGWEHSDKSTRSLEVDLVAKVVERILELANKSLPLDVGEHVVGVKEVAEKLIQCRVFETGVSALGLWGMGGIGKSTLARELYNQLCKRFEASCYVEDVTDKILQGHGVVEIQKRMLKDLCSSAIDNGNKSELKPILEERLSKKRIVVVLDDVSNVEMLDYMMTRKMLKKGSICIVTSRDMRVFEASNIFEPIEQEVYMHEVKMLNMEDSKRVFTSFAFGRDCEVRPKYEELATKISKLCRGVPLVLKVCGALLRGEVNLDVWEDVKSKLNSGGMLDDKYILNCLRISYDSLEEKEKKMFLDIACALLGKSEDMGICIWRSQELEPRLGVRNLKKKALISVDERGCFTMHDHLRDMGREIERVEAGGNTRRLWMPKSLSLLEEVKALPHSLQTLVITHLDPHIDLALSDMKELRILICGGTVNLISIPQNLRCLLYAKIPFGTSNLLRQNFPKVPEKNQLAILGCSGIKLTYDFWKSFESLTRLESMELKFNGDKDIFWERQKCVSNFDKLYMLRHISLYCFNGETISGFSSKHCNLRYLHLDYCNSLHSCLGVGDLFALEELSFDSCSKLKELPNLQQLTRLRKLNICYCDSIVAVPGLGNLVALVKFEAIYCQILVTLPDMHKLTNLQTLDLSDSSSLEGLPGLCELISLQSLEIKHEALQGGFNLHKLNKLVTLHVRNWSGPPAFTDVVSLERLRIWRSGEGIEMMPNLLNLARLQRVDIRNCYFKDVSCLGNLISLRSISLSFCRRLETLPDMHKLTRLETLEVGDCPNIMVWAGVSILKSSDTLWVDRPRIGTGMALHTLRLWDVGCRELPDLSLFPELEKLSIRYCWRLERLISTIPMTALEWFDISHCKELQEVPDLSQCRLLSHYTIWNCEKISLTTDQIVKLVAMWPRLKLDLRPEQAISKKRKTICIKYDHTSIWLMIQSIYFVSSMVILCIKYGHTLYQVWSYKCSKM